MPGLELIRAWLKAGYVEAEFFHETQSGVPQGGIISPLLLNVALQGLQQKLGPTFGCVVYADDLIVCATTRESLEAAKSTIEEWLQPRGLALHPEKTRIVHIDDGFNFLSFSIRKYRGKCLIKPQKEKVHAVTRRLNLREPRQTSLRLILVESSLRSNRSRFEISDYFSKTFSQTKRKELQA